MWTLIGKPFTRQASDRKRWFVKCRCKCGTVKYISCEALKRGSTKTCGCEGSWTTIGERSRKYDLAGKKVEYCAWFEMKKRCYCKTSPAYDRYGGRGITVCDSWLASFDNFYADMGARPGKGWSIDRINNDGNYEPANCRWATAKQQANNRRPRRAKNQNDSPAR